jgi:pimeloyl-ACP methyl ester carboxylesterase
MPLRVGHALLLHGAGGGGWEWNLWREVLTASRIEAVTPDLQPAASGLEVTTFDEYLVQARAALRALPRPRALIGASLGGLLAMACADEADALVLVNPLPPRPWSASLPLKEWPDVVRWRSDARLASTRHSLPGADDATALFAFRHWRDEAGTVLRTAQSGIDVAKPQCPVLCVVSACDSDVPPELTRTLAREWDAELLQTNSPSHAGPLLDRGAPALAARVAAWLSAR